MSVVALRGPLLYPTATDRWLAEDLLAPTSKKQYRMVLRTLQERNPGRRVNEFTPQDLVQFLTTPRRSGATIKNYRGALVRFFKWAKRRGLVKTNPAEDLLEEIRPRVTDVREHTWLSPNERRRLIESCDLSTPAGLRDSVALHLGFLTGMRARELTTLRWGHVDFSSKRISFIGKGNKRRTVGIPAQLLEILFAGAASTRPASAEQLAKKTP
jgi:integrase